MRLWHDLAMTIPAQHGMTIAVAEGYGIVNGNAVDLVQEVLALRPRAAMRGGKLCVELKCDFSPWGIVPYDSMMVRKRELLTTTAHMEARP